MPATIGVCLFTLTKNGRCAMADFDHLLLTRFSAVLGHHLEPASEEWLRYRLAFFYDACYSSVCQQLDAEFEWLVLFDDRCPEGFRADVETLAKGVFTPVWTHEAFRRDTFAPLVEAIAHQPFLITTRIDSDDAIATDFMAAVQRQFDHQELLFVNFSRGVQIDRSGAVYLCDQLSSPFLSLIEKRSEGRPPLTVFGPKHARARRSGPLREVRSRPMWAQVVHGSNLSNIVVGPRISPRVVNERFTMDLQYRRQLPVGRLVREKAEQRVRLARLWARHPGELTKWLEARAWRVRGTHQRRQGEPRTLTDVVRRQAQRLGYRTDGG